MGGFSGLGGVITALSLAYSSLIGIRAYVMYAQVTMKKNTISIYDYQKISDYLRDVVAMKKRENARFSLGVWARKLGVAGSGTLSNFLSGRRVPSDEALVRIKTDLKLSEYEGAYFDALIASSTKNIPEFIRGDLEDKLYSLKTGKTYRELSYDAFEVLSDPLALVIREAVKLEGFRWDSEWILSRLQLSNVGTARIESILQALLNVGLLRRDGDSLIQDDLFFKTPIDGSSEAMRLYYEAALEWNRMAVREIAPENRHLNSVTFCCSEEDLPELKKLIHEFSRKAMERYDRPKGRIVYQLHTQLIPRMSVMEAHEKKKSS